MKNAILKNNTYVIALLKKKRRFHKNVVQHRKVATIRCETFEHLGFRLSHKFVTVKP